MLTVRTIDLGRISYRACWEYQQRLFAVLTARRGDVSDEAGWLLTVEHPPVYTLGKSGKAQNLLVGEEFLRAKGAEYYHIDRGGDITFHGFDRGVVYLTMKGSCSGCPSSTLTLKMGIENLLRHYIPEVTEVRPVA